jgi:NodT family efflux transporter outer membrane factor (OMF) lipoprotein
MFSSSPEDIFMAHTKGFVASKNAWILGIVGLLTIQIGTSNAEVGKIAPESTEISKPTKVWKASVLKKQQPTLEATWKAAPPNLMGETSAAFPQYDWWQTFHDQALTNVIQTAISENPTLKAHIVQIAKAEANSRAMRSSLLPSLSLNPQYTWEKLGQNQFIFPIQGRNYQVFQLPLNARYELDPFGKNLAAYRSSKKGVRIAQYQYEAARIQLAGLVAATYFNVAKWRHLEILAQQELDSSDKLLRHSQNLLDLGQATLFDIQDKQQQRDQAQVNVIQFANNRQVAENYLLSLMGQSPTSHSLPTVNTLENLAYPNVIKLGIPSQLITRRPDVAAMEMQLSAAELNIQATRRALLPSIVLTGSTGYNAVGVNNLFKWSSLSSFGAATLAQSLYTGGRIKAQIQFEKANYYQLLNEYENTLITAFTDAENSLATLHANQIIFQDVTKQTENAREKATLIRKRYLAGVESEPAWLAEEVQRLQYEKQLVQQKTQLLIDAVGVAKAMGGGF